jgi:phospholipid/cholesterol/gamma-HCH transport system substrate-binding protein
MSRESNLQLKVGLFVLGAMLVLTYFVVSVTDISFTKKGYSMQVFFGFVNGLGDAAPVRLAGVEIGTVRNLKIFVDEKDQNKIKVLANIWIQEGMKIPTDSKITINQLGLLGEKYIEIIPGTGSILFKDKDAVLGKDPVSFETVTEDAIALMGKAKITIDSINNGILTDQNKKSLAETLSAFAEISNNIKNGKGTVGRLLNDDSIYKNLDDLTADLKGNPWKLLFRPKEVKK